jgi:hypothetical protein
MNIRRCQSSGEIEGESTGRLETDRYASERLSAASEAFGYTRERFLPPTVGWIGYIGHDSSDRCAVTAPADNIPEECVVLAKPLYIGDQQLRGDSIGFVAHIDNDQSSMFDPSEPLGHRPGLDRLGRRRRADCRAACQHPRSHTSTSSGFPRT